MEVDVREAFLNPQSVAVVGASRKRNQDCYLNPLEFMVEFGYQGKICAINPKAEEIFGVKSYPSLADVPGKVDLAVITLPRQFLTQSVKECVEKGIKAIIVYAQGLADADEGGKIIQKEIVKIARQGGARILGPNTMGVINAFNNFHSAFVPLEATKGKVPLTVVSQTGLFCYRAFHNNPYGGQGPIGKYIDLGNTADIDHSDILEWVEDDPDTRLIVLHIEGIRDGRHFFEAGRRVSRKKPIIAVKVGQTEAATRAIASHTGSLAGDDEVYEAAFKQSGIIRARDLDEMDDFIRAFLYLPLMSGKGVAIFSHIGGLCGIGVDACAKYGLELARLSPRTINKLGQFFPEWMTVSNPMDFWMAAMNYGSYPRFYQLALEALLEDENVSAALCSFWAAPIPEAKGGFFNIEEEINQVAAKFKTKPVVAFMYGPYVEERKIELEKEGRVLGFSSPDRAMKALATLYQYKQFISEG